MGSLLRTDEKMGGSKDDQDRDDTGSVYTFKNLKPKEFFVSIILWIWKIHRV